MESSRLVNIDWNVYSHWSHPWSRQIQKHLWPWGWSVQWRGEGGSGGAAVRAGASSSLPGAVPGQSPRLHWCPRSHWWSGAALELTCGLQGRHALRLRPLASCHPHHYHPCHPPHCATNPPLLTSMTLRPTLWFSVPLQFSIVMTSGSVDKNTNVNMKAVIQR